jgi:protein SCO1/2
MTLSKTTPSKRKARDPMNRRELMVLIIGLALAISFTLFFGLVMFSLEHPFAPPDPDARTLVIAPDFPRQLVDFSLTDQAGHPFTRRDLAGRIVVVSFVLTSCDVVCPYVNAQMEKIQQATAGRPDVKLISLSMDPVDDTAPILAQYGAKYNENPARWSFLTGYESEVYRLVGASFLPPDTTGEFSYMPGNFAHTQRIALVDPKGRLVDYFDGLDQNAADAVIREINKLETNPPSK